MAEHSDEAIREVTCSLTHTLQELFSGQPTASVYLAIGYVLGNMEMQAKKPGRDGTFRILGKAMDEFIEFNRPH